MPCCIGRSETRPETLVGLLGCRSAAEVQARREELCQTAYECGLYHDLGKCAVLMYIDNNARRRWMRSFSASRATQGPALTF